MGPLLFFMGPILLFINEHIQMSSMDWIQMIKISSRINTLNMHHIFNIL